MLYRHQNESKKEKERKCHHWFNDFSRLASFKSIQLATSGYILTSTTKQKWVSHVRRLKSEMIFLQDLFETVADGQGHRMVTLRLSAIKQKCAIGKPCISWNKTKAAAKLRIKYCRVARLCNPGTTIAYKSHAFQRAAKIPRIKIRQ